MFAIVAQGVSVDGHRVRFERLVRHWVNGKRGVSAKMIFVSYSSIGRLSPHLNRDSSVRRTANSMQMLLELSLEIQKERRKLRSDCCCEFTTWCLAARLLLQEESVWQTLVKQKACMHLPKRPNLSPIFVKEIDRAFSS